MGDNPGSVNGPLTKQNIPVTVLGVISYGLILLLKFRTFFSKKKETSMISSFGTKPLFSYTAIGFGIFMIALLHVITRIMNKMDVNVNYHHWLYMLFLLMPQFVIAFVTITYYVQYPILRNKIRVLICSHFKHNNLISTIN